MTDDVRIEMLTRLDLQPGDVLHVKVGGDMEDGLPPWVPTPEEMEVIYDDYVDALPEGVKVIITHHLVDDSAIRNLNCVSWPPKYPLQTR